MSNLLLKAKHWQLFLLIFAIPVTYYCYIGYSMMMEAMNNTFLEPNLNLSYMIYFPLVVLVFALVFFMWIWTLTMELQKKLPEHISLKVKIFKWCFWYYTIILTVSMILLFLLFDGAALNPDNFVDVYGKAIYNFTLFVLPMQLIGMFCMLYILYFVSKSLKTVMLQKEVKFEVFVAEFMMLWFYPFGIWILQPKINQLFNE